MADVVNNIRYILQSIIPLSSIVGGIVYILTTTIWYVLGAVALSIILLESVLYAFARIYGKKAVKVKKEIETFVEERVLKEIMELYGRSAS
jgi:hypothetical protein